MIDTHRHGGEAGLKIINRKTTDRLQRRSEPPITTDVDDRHGERALVWRISRYSPVENVI